MSPILGGIGGVSVRGFGHFPNLYFSSFDSIATTTVGAGGASTITFSSIPSTYTHLQLRGILFNSTDVGIIRLNNDSGNNYATHGLQGNGSAVSVYANTSVNKLMQLGTAVSNSTSPYTFVLDILDYTNTNKYKTGRALQGFDTNGGGQIQLLSGVWLNTNAVNRIDIIAASGTNAQYSQVALYGIKVA